MIAECPTLETVTIKGHLDWIEKMWSNQDELLLLCSEHQYDIKYNTLGPELIIDKRIEFKVHSPAMIRFKDIINGTKSVFMTVLQRPMIVNLINWKLGNECSPNIDKTICDSFESFTNSVLEIAFVYDALDSVIVDTMMHEMKKNWYDPTGILSDSTTNLFQSDIIFELFNNLQSINLIASDYTFSISCLS